MIGEREELTKRIEYLKLMRGRRVGARETRESERRELELRGSSGGGRERGGSRGRRGERRGNIQWHFHEKSKENAAKFTSANPYVQTRP